jgi:hypothetical protein
MHRPGFEPGLWAFFTGWKAQVIATRPSVRDAKLL